jgi:hypothetical protein
LTLFESANRDVLDLRQSVAGAGLQPLGFANGQAPCRSSRRSTRYRPRARQCPNVSSRGVRPTFDRRQNVHKSLSQKQKSAVDSLRPYGKSTAFIVKASAYLT